MEAEEKELALATMKGLLDGITDLFGMVLEGEAPADYQVIIKKKGTEDFCRERVINWSEAGKVDNKQADKEDDPRYITISKAKLNDIWNTNVAVARINAYRKGYKVGLEEGRKQVVQTSRKPESKMIKRTKSKDDYERD